MEGYMKKKWIGLMMVGVFALSFVSAYAQESVAGSWVLSLAGLSMQLVLTQQGETTSGTLDTPHGLLTLKGNFVKGKLTLRGAVHESGSADISATLQPDGSLSGAFSMNQMEMPFTAVRSKDTSKASNANGEVARVRSGVAALGRRWNATVKAETAKLYLPLHKSHNNSGIKQMRDLSYGPHPQQKLDLFVPDQGFNDLSPVFVFLHEGEDKIVIGTGELLYSNVARWIARFGGVGVNTNFRMPRDAASASGAEDVRMLVEWARGNVLPYGGDPNSIIVIGNGEGAVRLASYLFNEKSQPETGPGVAAAVLGSGLFASLPSNLVDRYQGKAVPLLMWTAELDPVESGVTELKDRLCRKYGKCPAFVELRGHNHVSTVMSIDSADTSVTDQLIRFYHTAVR
jgi:triacylglycerol lipase